jgi:tRNA modification GTPase
LAGDDLAIVTPVAGTTRDALRSTIQIEGIPLHIIDTAGLRETDDEVERIGIERSWQEIGRADVVLQSALAERRLGEIELCAEELRLAQEALATITGEFTADDLLGEIFSRFCIGK